MKKFIAALLILAFTNHKSQNLILTQAANAPIVGDTGKFYVIDTSAYASGLGVALTGSNVVWNYSNLSATSNSVTGAYIDSSAAPGASNYLGCNLVQKQGSLYSFYKSVSTPSAQLQFMGMVSPSLSLNFTNTAISNKYPFTFGNSYTDNFAGSFTYSFSGTASGNATVTADGTGTLNLPGGVSLTNVLRVKNYQSTTFNVGGFPAGSIKQTLYEFYHSSQKFPILTIDYSSMVYGLGSPSVMVQVTGNINNFVVGIHENTKNDLGFSMFPNPSSDMLNIKADDMNKINSVEIFNQLGESVYKGKFEKQIPINYLTSGIYFIEIRGDRGVAMKKFIKE